MKRLGIFALLSLFPALGHAQGLCEAGSAGGGVAQFIPCDPIQPTHPIVLPDPPADPVPEPASLTLLGVGLAGLIAHRIRRRN